MAICGLFVLSLFLVSLSGADDLCSGSSMPIPQPRPKPEEGEYTCGDKHCICNNKSIADCTDRSLYYIPKMPATISELWFDGNCVSSEMLTGGVFANATNLSTLTMDYNPITNIPQDVFKAIKNLTQLHINAVEFDIDDIKYLLTLPSLRFLSVERCEFTSLPPNVFSSIESNVTTLLLAENTFRDFNLTELLPLKDLKILGLESCKIGSVNLDTPLRLQKLKLAKNSLLRFPSTCTKDRASLLPDLEHLDLSTNQIQRLTAFCLPKLTRLILFQNSLYRLLSDSFSTFRANVLPSLQYLDIGFQKPARGSTITIGYYVFNNAELTELHLTNNNVKFHSDDSVKESAFKNCPKLAVLFLDGNTFEGVDDERFQLLFGHLPLKNLSMKRSQVGEVYSRTITQFSALVELDLSSNKITNIQSGAFDWLPNLTFLDLSNNKVSVVTENTIGKATRKRLTELSLGNNPFDCSCDLVWFRNWLTSNKSLFYRVKHEQNFLQYRCSNIQNVMVEDFSVVEQACLLSKETNIQIIVVCSLIISTWTFISLLFRYRWHIRLLLYESFRDRGEARSVRLQTNHFDYDVFVSYASEDLPWVREHLMPELEDRLGLRLCVHERDFIPGKNIVDNIADCVENSKKIMMVFSRDFIKSQWCQFELTYCLSHAMDHDDVLIIVCVDDVASREMTTAMMAVLKTTTFIDWVELDDAMDAFWGRVYMSLNEIMDQGHP